MSFNWDYLLNPERRRATTKVAEDKRSEFERDYDRLVSSSSLRRLQDKTQVFPLERHDFIRTRLTHSLEVSTLGRSFGVDIVRTLSQKGIPNITERQVDIAAINTDAFNIPGASLLVERIRLINVTEGVHFEDNRVLVADQ